MIHYRLSLLFAVCIFFFFLSCSNDDDSSTCKTSDWRQLTSTLLVGSHRGLLGYPENSYESIVAAIEAGYKVVEIDIARTKDGVFVVHHDSTIDRCSDGSGKVSDYTFEELQKFNFGHYLGRADTKIRSLDEIMRLLKERNIAVELDMSNNTIVLDEYTYDIYEIVEKNGMLKNTLFCGNLNKMDILTNLNNELNINPSLWQVSELEDVLYLRKHCKILCVSLPKSNITKDFCNIAHNNDIIVETWTCVDVEEIEKAKENGVDYILVDMAYYPL